MLRVLDRVREAHGAPEGQDPGASQWRYEGVVFFFDAFDRVHRIVLTR